MANAHHNFKRGCKTMVMRTRKRRVLLIGLLMIVGAIIPEHAEANDSFVSASMVRSLFEDTYPWFSDGAVKEHLFFEAESGDLKLFGFRSETSPVEEFAIFLVTVTDGVNRVKDITKAFNARYAYYYYIDTLQLPDLDNVILVQAFYITHHVLPSLYLISKDGVILGVKGEIFEIEDEIPFRITSVDYSDAGIVPWLFGFETMHPTGEIFEDGSFFWSSPDSFQASPYTRYVYEWCKSSLAFEMVDSSPVNHAAVIEVFINAVSKSAWKEASEYLADVRWATQDDFESDPVIIDLSSGIKEFAGFTNPNTIRLESGSGSLIDFIFDIGWEESYQSARRSFQHQHQLGPWAPQPKIKVLQRVSMDE